MAKSRGVVTIGGLANGVPIPFSSGDNGQRSDFRQVPKSDVGNEGYRDRGQLGSWSPSEYEPYPLADGIKCFDGYGATMAEIELGYVKPDLSEDPAYDKVNYQERWNLPKDPMEDFGNRSTVNDDWEFRARNRRSRGFLTRPYLPTER